MCSVRKDHGITWWSATKMPAPMNASATMNATARGDGANSRVSPGGRISFAGRPAYVGSPGFGPGPPSGMAIHAMTYAGTPIHATAAMTHSTRTSATSRPYVSAIPAATPPRTRCAATAVQGRAAERGRRLRRGGRFHGLIVRRSAFAAHRV